MPLLEQSLTPAELDLFRSLTTPRKIQDFLDTVRYEPEYFNRAPLRVLRERTGHCLDGALFAAAALQRLGYPEVGTGGTIEKVKSYVSCAIGRIHGED